MTYVNVDIPLDDILSGMGSKEKQRLADDLFADGYYQTELEKEIEGGADCDVSANEQLFREELNKIRHNYLNLTTEEQEVIQKIGKRF